MKPEDLTFYAIRNHEGEFLESQVPWKWNKNVDLCKIYRNIAPPRGVITTFANEFLTKPVPKLIIFKVGEIIVEDQEERVAEARRRLQEKWARQGKHQKEQTLAELKRQRDELDKKIQEWSNEPR